MDAIQVMERFGKEADARECFAFNATQAGFLGGRILEPLGPAFWTNGAPLRTGWTVQVFFDADGVQRGDWLPDGMRLVIIPESQRRALGVAQRGTTRKPDNP